MMQRILTALVLVPLVVAGVLYFSTPLLALVLALAVLVGGWEWARLAGMESRQRVLYLLLIGLLLGVSALLIYYRWYWGYWLFAAASGWWLLVTLFLLNYHPERSTKPGILGKSLFGLLVLVPAWASLVMIHGLGDQGPQLVLFLMVLIWVADSFAYFSGRRWGRVKLAPAISPGKTREGVYGALAGAVLCGFVLAWLRPHSQLLFLLVFCVLVALISVVGDLFESLMKRQAGLKDSGNLLPGHGGMLDRIDSLTAASPLFLFGLLLMGEPD